jgi:hypothetical protein
MAEAPLVDGIEADLLHRGRVAPDQVVSRLAELAHERQLERLHVLDSTPGEVRRLLARERREIAPVDQRDPRAATRQAGGRHRAIDPATEDEHVENTVAQSLYVRVPKG